MPRELIYTSAIQGLLPGSRGFCTVAASPDLTRPQLIMLESLSAYRHEFVSGPDMRLNPVAYCHFIVPLAGQMFHVVSRIADAGLDYSRRTNVIAHHLVVSPEEMTQTDPGAIAAATGSFVLQWNQTPKSLPVRTVSAPPLLPGPCQHWADLTGDAGWGGVLAAAGTSRPVVLVYRPGQDIFPLINEALALIPRQDRWKIGFSTFCQKLPPGVVCQWKGVLSRSPEAISASALPNALILDCTQPFPRVRPTTELESHYVNAARTGVVEEITPESKRQVVKKVPLARREVAVPHSDTPPEPLQLYTRDSAQENVAASGGDDSYAPVASDADAETLDRLAQLNSIYADMALPQRNNRQFILRLVIGIVVALLVAVAFLSVFRQEIQNHFFSTNEVSTPSSTSAKSPLPSEDDRATDGATPSGNSDKTNESANTDRVIRP